MLLWALSGLVGYMLIIRRVQTEWVGPRHGAWVPPCSHPTPIAWWTSPSEYYTVILILITYVIKIYHTPDMAIGGQIRTPNRPNPTTLDQPHMPKSDHPYRPSQDDRIPRFRQVTRIRHTPDLATGIPRIWPPVARSEDPKSGPYTRK